MDLKTGDTRLIIDACKAHGLLVNQAAYVLATAWHETAHTMKPVREMGGEKYLKAKPYYPYVGMGYVQLTWLANYQRASEELGVDFVKNPRLLLEAKYAAPILVIGSKEGWFTAKKLSTYLTASKSDYVNARRIINGTDKAALIAGHAKAYEKLLRAADYAPGAASQPVETAPTRTDSILSRGSRGPIVGDLQANLNTLGYGPLKVDEHFGGETEKAVMSFQLDNGLKVDGIAGGRTSTAIGKAIADKELKPAIEKAEQKAEEAEQKVVEAEKTVPETAREEVKEKTSFWSWLLGALGVGGGGLSAISGAQWQTVVAIGGVAVVALVVMLIMRRQIIEAFKDINRSARS
jgi:hypothetical protein